MLTCEMTIRLTRSIALGVGFCLLLPLFILLRIYFPASLATSIIIEDPAWISSLIYTALAIPLVLLFLAIYLFVCHHFYNFLIYIVTKLYLRKHFDIETVMNEYQITLDEEASLNSRAQKADDVIQQSTFLKNIEAKAKLSRIRTIRAAYH